MDRMDFLNNPGAMENERSHNNGSTISQKSRSRSPSFKKGVPAYRRDTLSSINRYKDKQVQRIFTDNQNSALR